MIELIDADSETLCLGILALVQGLEVFRSHQPCIAYPFLETIEHSLYFAYNLIIDRNLLFD